VGHLVAVPGQVGLELVGCLGLARPAVGQDADCLPAQVTQPVQLLGQQQPSFLL
jgi:hypothetical protein